MWNFFPPCNRRFPSTLTSLATESVELSVVAPVALNVPSTSNLCCGSVFPIPTLDPLSWILFREEPPPTVEPFTVRFPDNSRLPSILVLLSIKTPSGKSPS